MIWIAEKFTSHTLHSTSSTLIVFEVRLSFFKGPLRGAKPYM